jgi:hypothetical protein
MPADSSDSDALYQGPTFSRAVRGRKENWLKPSLAQALCGTAEAVPFVRGPSFSAEVVPYVLHFSTPTWFRNRGSQHQPDQ